MHCFLANQLCRGPGSYDGKSSNNFLLSLVITQSKVELIPRVSCLLCICFFKLPVLRNSFFNIKGSCIHNFACWGVISQLLIDLFALKHVIKFRERAENLEQMFVL